MTTNVRVITPPSAEPVMLGEAMIDCAIDLDNRIHDDWFTRKIRQAREHAEQFCERCLTDAVYEYRCDALGCGICLPFGDVGSVLSITYVDSDGATQTLAEDQYIFNEHPRAPAIYRAYGVTWPTVRCQPNAVTVQFKGAYDETISPPRSPPEAIKGAMTMMIAHWFENRSTVVVGDSAAEIPLGATHMMYPYRLGLGV